MFAQTNIIFTWTVASNGTDILAYKLHLGLYPLSAQDPFFCVVTRPVSLTRSKMLFAPSDAKVTPGKRSKKLYNLALYLLACAQRSVFFTIITIIILGNVCREDHYHSHIELRVNLLNLLSARKQIKIYPMSNARFARAKELSMRFCSSTHNTRH